MNKKNIQHCRYLLYSGMILFLFSPATTVHSHVNNFPGNNNSLVRYHSENSFGDQQTNWSKTIELQDFMKRYVFPEELISYQIEFPGSFKAEELKLSENNSDLEYQLGDIEKDHKGNLLKARIYFRAGLDKGQKRTFILQHDPAYNADFKDLVTLQPDHTDLHTAVLYTNKQQVHVPYGDWQPDDHLSNVHAPLISISYAPGDWVGPGKMYGDLIVKRVKAEPLEDGNLLMKYRVQYYIEGNRRYEVILSLKHNERHITIDEKFENINPEDGLAFRFSYTDGIDPDARMAVSQHKYNPDTTTRWPWCGPYDQQIKPDGTLPYQLGQWNPHSAITTHATLFWNDTPEIKNAIIFSVYRVRDWKTHLRYVWYSGDAKENLYFYQKEGEKYMQTALCGKERHWAVSVFHENKKNPITIESQDGSRRFYWEANRNFEGLTTNKNKQRGGGPEIRLLQKLTDFSLEWVKDLIFEWDENVNARFRNAFHGEEDIMTYEEYLNGPGVAGEHNFKLVEHFWPSYLGGAQTLGRGQPDWIPDYAASRKNWTIEQRKEVRAILVHWISSLMMHDLAHAHFSMISGHPNFIIETLFAGIYCKIFPNHPDAPKWKEVFLDMWDEYLKVYLRHSNRNNYTLAGRHTECITTYSRASLRGVLDNIRAFREYDGTDLTAHPRFKEWIRWHMYALVTAAPWDEDDFHTYTPPQGAHAREVPSPNHSEWHDMFFRLADEIRPGDPELADNFMWALTRGEKGIKPHLESALFTDYGAVLRYDFGGPNEAYLNIQQINSWSGTWNEYRLWGSMNYRWSSRGNGSLYYAANNNIWSWNGIEDNGDEFDIDQLPVFKVDEKGLMDHETDGILYNFDVVQFYRANGSSEDYFSRDVMMVRDDYIAVYDNVSEGVEGEFLWNNPYWEQPAIHVVTEGQGDNLHIIEPIINPEYDVKKNSFGAELKKEGNTEYVFMSDRFISVENENLSFIGRTGYASNGFLAIFEGSMIRSGDFILELTGQGFGASASIESDGSIRGRISGNGSGNIIVTFPGDFNVKNRVVYINGEKVKHQIDGNSVIFKCSSSVTEGYYLSYDIINEEDIPTLPPVHPNINMSMKK